MRVTTSGEGRLNVVMFPWRGYDGCAPYGAGATNGDAYASLVEAVVMYLEAPWAVGWRRSNGKKVRRLKAWRARQPINVVARAFRGWLVKPAEVAP